MTWPNGLAVDTKSEFEYDCNSVMSNRLIWVSDKIGSQRKYAANMQARLHIYLKPLKHNFPYLTFTPNSIPCCHCYQRKALIYC